MFICLLITTDQNLKSQTSLLYFWSLICERHKYTTCSFVFLGSGRKYTWGMNELNGRELSLMNALVRSCLVSKEKHSRFLWIPFWRTHLNAWAATRSKRSSFLRAGELYLKRSIGLFSLVINDESLYSQGHIFLHFLRLSDTFTLIPVHKHKCYH